MSSHKEFRLALIGACGVGKTSLCCVFVKDRFSISYNPTEEEFYRQNANINGVGVTLDIIDVNVNSQCFKQTIASADGYIFIYDISNRATFEKVIDLHNQAISIKSSPFFPQILAGNKSDKFEYREVSFETGARTAGDWGCKFCEVSAKNNTQVAYLFTECANSVLQGKCSIADEKQCCKLF